MYNLKCRGVLVTPFILITLIISWASSQATMSGPDVFFGVDKLYHLSAFFIYGICCRLFTEGIFYINHYKLKLYMAAFLGIAFGAIDELHQSFVPGRDASILDFLADVLGVFISTFVWNKIINFIRARYLEKCSN